MFSLLFALLFAALPARAADQLVFAVDVIRHGDRTPINELPKAPHDWAEGLGQLTSQGMRQEHELGSRMRDEYVERTHLLPPNYKTGTLYVRSSDIDRTLMSAQAVLLGLYPHGTGPTLDGKPALPDTTQLIPIHTVASEAETLLYPDSALYHYDQLLAQYVTPTPQWRQKTSSLQPKFSAWSLATGVAIKDLYELKSVGDTLFVERTHQLPAPEGLSPEDVQEIIDAGHWAFVEGFRPGAIGKATGHALLEKIADYLRDARERKSPLRYVLFSAHDSTLMSQMSALGSPLPEVPHYASRLNFALLRAGSDDYRVKVTYNEQPVSVPGCGPDSCTLAQFLALAKL